MTDRPTEAWTSEDAYERYVGRWSRLVAPRFLTWLPGESSAVWCDVGCGTGALAHAILATQNPVRVLGVDRAEPYLAAARRAATDLRFDTAASGATAIPARDGEFDRVVSALLLNFVPQPAEALAEMRRITRPGGLIGGYVWDYAEGMRLIRLFWDAATALDTDAAELDEGRRFPICRPDPLRALFVAAGLVEVDVGEVTVPTVFADFDDLWEPFLGGQGPAPGYCAGLSGDRRDALRERLRAMLPRRPDGAIPLEARAWTVRGRVR
ncbi:class I SAM-dependent methyltransferase [Pseudonocardia asaccharolytica]|uniref:Methyltransferase n=1 Tax=Pseudonocardia asaccharolytica DSM 44247 = NBRC 16224 TaxID=1123024 RepID=A0A511D7Q8_9PSEU|nr:class I SAM-dependent methyltransferase [Pseudonocardia asaccharolytica]GEL20841.1 methyltransferase [Pseudonocardia asaccharolytica DSM 44247 = NBRC 16224]